ncbi:MAG TPA: hypothetical protein VIR32_01935 [Lachnospiraceae bacterium]
MANEKLIEDIISMLDNSVEKGTGHVNIKVDTNNQVQAEKLTRTENDEIEKIVETIGCTTCAR